MFDKPNNLILCINSFNKLNKTWELLLDPLYITHIDCHLYILTTNVNILVNLYLPQLAII